MNSKTSTGLPAENENTTKSGVRMVVLVENTSCAEDIIPEHGLAIYIEFNGQKGLYDTGQTSVILDNADTSYIDLEDLDWIALSHGHYDHTGGLLPVLEESDKTVPVYVGQGAFTPKYALRDNNKFEEIGIPYSKDEIIARASTVTEVSDFTEIFPNVFLVGPATLTVDYEQPAKYLKIMDKDGNYIPDEFADERTLVLKAEDGIIIITGCAHRGAVNIIRHVKSYFENERILLVVGGFHLGKTKDEIIRKKIADLQKFNIEAMGLCHCTGARASKTFMEEMSDICFIAPAGSEIML